MYNEECSMCMGSGEGMDGYAGEGVCRECGGSGVVHRGMSREDYEDEQAESKGQQMRDDRD